MAPDTPAIEALRQTFGAAIDYGLSYEEVWSVVNEVVERTPPDTPAGEAFRPTVRPRRTAPVHGCYPLK
jgi:hypothetical protein